ncbi:hypothetical protein EBZ39_12170 [bacterium]|nr:hypothetical protein [bacterium]
MNHENIIQFGADELMAGFQNLENNTFFKLFMSEVRDRYERSIGLLTQEHNMSNEHLHTLRGIISTYKTVLNMPRIIIEQVRVEESRREMGAPIEQ